MSSTLARLLPECVFVYLCPCASVCVRARNGCAAAVSFWAVYGSHTIPSSCSSVSHMSIRAAVIGWERSRRGRRAGMDGQREGSAVGGGEGRRGVGRKWMSCRTNKKQQCILKGRNQRNN